MKKALLLLVALLAFALISLPAFAGGGGDDGGGVEETVEVFCDFDVFIAELADFDVECYINSVVIDDCDDFLPFYNIGYVEYSVCSNVPWALTGYWDFDDENPDETELPFPEDWVIWYAYPDSPSEFYVFPEDEDGTALLDEGDCDDFEDRIINFGFSGPDICDPAGEYGATIWFFLGAV